jgi:hypothetical protein
VVVVVMVVVLPAAGGSAVLEECPRYAAFGRDEDLSDLEDLTIILRQV